MVAAGPSVVGASLVFADGSGNPAAVKNEDGKYYDKEGSPIQDSAALTRIAMSVMVPMAKDRATHRRSAIP